MNSLLAPNGKPTNLTPEQYKLVRTKAFKQWFGDWEKDPANASKVVDENGEPLVVYHGTKNDFNTFDKRKVGFNTSNALRGFYFTDNSSVAYSYTYDENEEDYLGNVIEVFLYANKIKIIDAENKDWVEFSETAYIDKEIKNAFESGNDCVMVKNIADAFIDMNNGTDYYGNTFVVDNSNQIKLADGSNTTFDSNNNDIRFSLGGEIESYKEFFDKLKIENGSKYVGKKFGEVFPFLANKVSPVNFRNSVKQYNGILSRLEKNNYSTKSMKTADLNKLERIKKYIDKKKYLSRFYLDPKGNIISFDNSDNAYAKGGSVLLAPNGKPSNLTPQQYKLVRTPAFKEWFGDWQNDPANASKVVDENGEPLVVYHGSKNKFNLFDKKRIGERYKIDKKGFFFTNSKIHADLYATKIGYTYSLFLSIKNPLEININVPDPIWKWDYEHKSILKKLKNEDGIIIMSEAIYDNGQNQKHIICFEPNQIKLADGTNTTFDGNNPDIRFVDGGKVEDLISQGVVELKMFDTKPEHAKEYGLDSVNPLFVQSLCITENQRLKGIGNKVLQYIDDYAIKNGHDVVFGHITQKAEFTKDNRETFFCDTDMIKNWLHSKGYAIQTHNNDFHKVINNDIRFVDGGKVDSFGKVEEVIINPTEINCHRCHWHWEVKNGGDDLFICHNCNYDNTKYYKFEGKEGERILATMSLKEGGKASNIDSNELKMENGGILQDKDSIRKYAENLLKDFDYKYTGFSETDYGKSMYFDVDGIKCRFSDHTTTNKHRGTNEIHFQINDVNSESTKFNNNQALLELKYRLGYKSISYGKTPLLMRSGKYLEGFGYTDIKDNKMEKGGELAKGIKAEQEHSETIKKFKKKGVSVNDIAKSIALDHIKEDSKYYTKLEKMEKTKFADGGGVDGNEPLVVSNYILNRHPIKGDVFQGGKVDGYKIVKFKKFKKHYGIIYEILLIDTKANADGNFNKRIVGYTPQTKKISDFNQSFLTATKGKYYTIWSDSEIDETFADGGGVAQVIDPNQQQVIYVDENGYLVEEDKGLIDKVKEKGKQGINFIKEHPELLLKEGGAIDTITKLEIDAMKRSINDPNTSEYLKKTYNKILAKYDVDISKPYEGKYKEGKYIDTYDFSGYEYMKNKNEEAGVSFLLTGEYELVSKAIFEKDYSMWLFYNYLGRINISFQACKDWLKQATEYFADEMPVPINLTHTPHAKDGRSFALWYATSNFQSIKDKFGDEKVASFEYNGVYYYQEIGMVGNFDNNNDGWGSYYKEKKTGLLIPEFTQTSFHFNTLIHELSHCLDFQTQLLINIDKFNFKQSQKDVSVVIDDNTTDLEKQLYGMSLESNDGNFVAHPITNHFDFFVDALIKILRACASGKIPLTQLYEQQALDVQTTLSGVYGDLLLEQRERKRKEGVALKKQDELRANTRFTWQDKWVMDAKNYIIKNAQQQGLKESLNSKTSEFTLSEIIELDNLINRYIETEFRKYLAEQPTKAQSLVEPIKLMKKESNRIINNHYDNIKNKYEYGFNPQNDLDYYLQKNCDYKDFKDYKDWKQCMISSIQSYKS